MDNAGHLILAQVREKQKGPARKGKHAEKMGKKIALARLGTWVCSASVLWVIPECSVDTLWVISKWSLSVSVICCTVDPDFSRTDEVLKIAFSDIWPPPIWGGAWCPQSYRGQPRICLYPLYSSQRCFSLQMEKGGREVNKWLKTLDIRTEYLLYHAIMLFEDNTFHNTWKKKVVKKRRHLLLAISYLRVCKMKPI